MSAPTITPEDFAFVSQMLMKEAAIVLESGKEYLAVSRLAPLARQLELGEISDLVKGLRTNPHGPLKGHVVDAMTTNETLWFRDTHPFDTLRDSIIPELMKERATKRSIDIWCAAASTGQEPYTLAMMLTEAFPQLASWRVRIIASDISPSAISRAKTGRYTQMEIGRGLPAKYLVKYFSRVGAEFEISPAIRKMVDFKVMNLAAPWPPYGTFDMVFVRNVLIYFNQQTKADIINKAEKLLRPDGYLFLGSTESLLGVNTELKRDQRGKTTCYRLAGA